MSEVKEKTKTEEIEVDASVAEAISNSVLKGLSEKVEQVVDKKLSEKEDSAKKLVENTEAVIKKNVEGYLKDVNIITGKEGDPEKESIALRTFKACKAFAKKDWMTLKRYNEKAIDNVKTEVGYQNKGTDADGGYVVMDPDFEAQVENIMPAYGVMLPEVTVVPNQSGRVKTNKRGSNVTMYEISEGSAITASKMAVSQMEGTLRKFAGMVVNTNELMEDEAIDWYAELVEGFAEEKARLIDYTILTDTDSTYPGILRADDTVAVTFGAAITDIDWNDIYNMKFNVPSATAKQGVYVMHRTVWNTLIQTTGTTNDHPIYDPKSLVDVSGNITMPWGDRVVLSDVMPSISEVGDSNEPYVVYGNFKRCRLYMKGGYTIDQSGDATVVDQASATKNLFQMDMNALRVKFRMLALHKFPEQFSIGGTGNVS